MDFFAMKRKKLQSLCKKHGIPANLKNKDMAEKLCLIYKEEKNENPGSSRLPSDVDKSNVEIIVLDSDSDSEVQMEALDTVAENDFNEKTDVSTEDLLDKQPDQFLTTSPRSEVKSDHNIIPHTDDSDTAAGNDDASTAVKHTDEVKSSDLNNLMSHPLRSDEDKSNLEFTELHSDNDIDVQMEASDIVAEKNCNERTDVSAGHLPDEEPNQFLTTSPLTEVKSSDLNNLVSCPLRTDEDKSNLEITEMDSDSDTDVQMEASDAVAEKDSYWKTNVSAGHLVDKEPDQFQTTSPLSEVKSRDLNVQHTVDSGIEMLGDQTSRESTDVDEDTDLHQGSVGQFNKLDDYHCVISQSATTCLDASPGVKNTDDNTNVNVENILDEVHSSSFEDSDESLVQSLKTVPLSEVETSDLDADKMVVTGTATKNAYTSGAKFESSQKMSITPASKEIVGSSTKLLNDSVSPRDVVFCNVEEGVQIGADKEQVDPSQEKMMEFPPKLFNYPGTPTNGGIGLCGFEENLEIGVNKENIDPNEDVIDAEPSAIVMSDNADLIPAVSEELGNKLMEDNLESGVNKENIDLNEDVMHAEPSAMVISDKEDLIQAVPEELGNNLMEDEVANMDDKFDVNVPGSANPGVTNSFQGSNVCTNLDTYVTGGDILDDVHSSSFEYSDVTPVQFLPTDLLREAETSDLDVHKMFETATATRNADISGVKIESLPKMSLYPTPEKMIGSSTRLLSNSGIPTNFGFCDVEESLQIAVNKENIDPSDEVLHAEPSLVSRLLQSDEDKSNLEITEHDSDNDIDVQMEASDTVAEKDCNERTNVSAEHLLDEEPDQFITTSPLSEVKSSDLNNLVSHLLRSDEDKSNLEITELDSDSDTDVQMEASDTVADKDCNVRTNVSAGHLLDEEPDQFLTTSPLCEVKSSDLNVQHTVGYSGTAAVNADAREVKPATPSNHNVHDMIDSGTPTNGDNELCGLEENLEIGVNKENVDPNEDVIYAEPSAMIMSDKEDLIQAVSEELGVKLMEENLEFGFTKGNIDPSEDLMHAEPTAMVMGDNEDFIQAVSEELGNKLMEENMEIRVNKENIDPDEDVMHAEPSALVMSDNEDFIQAVSEEFGNDLTEDEVPNVDDKFDILENVPESVNPSGTNSTQGTNTNTDLNIYGGDILEEVHSFSFGESDWTPVQSLPTDLLREAETTDFKLHKMFKTATATKNADTSGVKFESSPNMSLSPTPEKISNSSTKLINVDENLRIGANIENVDPSDEVFHAEHSAIVMSDKEDLIQAVSEELGNNLAEDEVANVGDKFDLLENVPGSANPGVTNSTQGSNINTDLNTYVTSGDILDEVHSTSFAESDWTSVQSLPTDRLREVETSDLSLHKLSEAGTATKNADISGVKIESSPKLSLCLTPEKMIGSSSKLLNNSGSSTKFGFCDMEENMQIGVNKEKIDPSDEVLHAEPSLMVMSDNEEVDLSMDQMAALEACEEEMLKSSEKTCLVADHAECIGLSLNDLEASTTKCSAAETYFESTALGDVMETCNMEGSMQTNMMEEENQAYSASRKRKMSDVDDTEGANSDEEVKADELVPAVPQSSEMESCDFGIQQLLAQVNTCNMEGSMQTNMTDEENQTYSASRKRKMSDVDDAEGANSDEVVKADELVPAVPQSSEMESCDFGIQQLLAQGSMQTNMTDEENQTYSAIRKRKMSDVDDTEGANSDEVVKADELVPAVLQSSEMESCDFGIQQLFAQDTASEDEDAYQKKSDSSSREKSIICTPKLHESSMMHKKTRIEMNLSQKPAARDSLGTSMKENIKTDKEEVSSMMSRNKFAKRLPLQDLHQN